MGLGLGLGLGLVLGLVLGFGLGLEVGVGVVRVARSHVCRRVPGPPNLGISRQLPHAP